MICRVCKTRPVIHQSFQMSKSKNQWLLAQKSSHELTDCFTISLQASHIEFSVQQSPWKAIWLFDMEHFHVVECLLCCFVNMKWTVCVCLVVWGCVWNAYVFSLYSKRRLTLSAVWRRLKTTFERCWCPGGPCDLCVYAHITLTHSHTHTHTHTHIYVDTHFF